jgi:hypothetical protein
MTQQQHAATQLYGAVTSCRHTDRPLQDTAVCPFLLLLHKCAHHQAPAFNFCWLQVLQIMLL